MEHWLWAVIAFVLFDLGLIWAIIFRKRSPEPPARAGWSPNRIPPRTTTTGQDP